MWRAYDLQLKAKGVRESVRNLAVERYRGAEEKAWRMFDAIIAINGEERAAVAAAHPEGNVLEAGMGLDLSAWGYSWRPVQPPRLVFYGGLNGQENQRSVIRCISGIMPLVWTRRADVEFWVIGSNPPRAITDLADGKRVRVTGFVPEPAEVLGTAMAVLCPWQGRYGFRSRLIEVMAGGTPVIASPDAYSGMHLTESEGLLPAHSNEDFAAIAAALIEDPQFAARQSRLARAQVERQYSFDQTYGRLARELRMWIHRPAQQI